MDSDALRDSGGLRAGHPRAEEVVGVVPVRLRTARAEHGAAGAARLVHDVVGGVPGVVGVEDLPGPGVDGVRGALQADGLGAATGGGDVPFPLGPVLAARGGEAVRGIGDGVPVPDPHSGRGVGDRRCRMTSGEGGHAAGSAQVGRGWWPRSRAAWSARHQTVSSGRNAALTRRGVPPSVISQPTPRAAGSTSVGGPPVRPAPDVRPRGSDPSTYLPPGEGSNV
jgi:hypothetical protein